MFDHSTSTLYQMHADESVGATEFKNSIVLGGQINQNMIALVLFSLPRHWRRQGGCAGEAEEQRFTERT
jgi:hypothetical protein